MYLYQIEISNYCSLKCTYCPHPKQVREKGFMSFDTFKKCVKLFKRCENRENLFLHNFGEVLLHPDIIKFVQYASEKNVEVSFFTNGIKSDGSFFDEDLYHQLHLAGLKCIDFSAHKIPLNKFKKIVNGHLEINNVFIPNKKNLGNWGGQILDISVVKNDIDKPCIFERQNCMVVLWNGDIATCCIDVEGAPHKYTVDDLLNDNFKYLFNKIPLCKTCTAMRDDELI